MEKTEAQRIADTILAQMGGNRFLAMTGAKYLTFDKNGDLAFRLPGSGLFRSPFNFVRIHLNGLDLYDMIFEKKITNINSRNFGSTTKQVKKTDLYADQIQEIFTEVTGLYTHL